MRLLRPQKSSHNLKSAASPSLTLISDLNGGFTFTPLRPHYFKKLGKCILALHNVKVSFLR